MCGVPDMSAIVGILLAEIEQHPELAAQLAEALGPHLPTEGPPRLLTADGAAIPMLMSVAKAAEALGCSPRTVRRRIADGSLPGVIEHGRVMVRADELHDHIERLDRPGAAPRSRARRAGQDFDWLRDGEPSRPRAHQAGRTRA